MNRSMTQQISAMCRFGLLGLLIHISSGWLAAAEMSTSGDIKLETIVVGQPQRVEVQPAKFKLETPRREMHLVVSGFYAGDIVQDLTRAAKFTSTDPSIV